MEKLYLSIAFVCMGWLAQAQDSLKTVQLDEVVITGTKSEIPVEKSGKTIYKITRADIEKSSAATVPDLLNEVPGVQMDGNFGPFGTNIEYFVRGAQSKRTLILIDGVPFNDPSGIDQTYDLRLLDFDMVESIEVLKGGLSTLYGTGAAAGVINIQLRKPSEEKISGSVGVAYGSFQTAELNAGVSGKNGKVSYLFNGGTRRSEGFSAASDAGQTGTFDDDGYIGYNFLGKAGYDFSEFFQMQFVASYDAFDTDIDAGAFSDSPTDFSNYKQVRIGLKPSYKWENGKIQADLFSNTLERVFASFGTETNYDANNYQADVLVEQNVSDVIKLIGGLNYQYLGYSQDQSDNLSFYMVDPYVTFIYDKAGFNMQAGSRWNRHSDYGNNLVYNVNPSYYLDTNSGGVKIYGSYATAFITPSLFQLFGPFGANPELTPEKSESLEFGTAWYKRNLSVELVYFHRKDDNLIIYTDQYENASERIETDGIELSSEFSISKTLLVRANYAHTRRKNEEKMFRIPTHKYGMSLQYEPIDRLNTSLSFLHTGERNLRYFNNTSFQTEEVQGAAFDLVDVKASYEIRNMRISASIRNLFDEQYQSIVGFNSVGRNYRLALNCSF